MSDLVERQRIGLDWRLIYCAPPANPESRFALTPEGDLLCRSNRQRPGRYVVVSGKRLHDGAIVIVRPKDLAIRYPTGSEIKFTVTRDPADEDHAGVYRNDDHEAIYTALAEIFWLTGPIGLDPYGCLDGYRPLPKGATFVITAT